MKRVIAFLVLGELFSTGVAIAQLPQVPAPQQNASPIELAAQPERMAPGTSVTINGTVARQGSAPLVITVKPQPALRLARLPRLMPAALLPFRTATPRLLAHIRCWPSWAQIARQPSSKLAWQTSRKKQSSRRSRSCRQRTYSCGKEDVNTRIIRRQTPVAALRSTRKLPGCRKISRTQRSSGRHQIPAV